MSASSDRCSDLPDLSDLVKSWLHFCAENDVLRTSALCDTLISTRGLTITSLVRGTVYDISNIAGTVTVVPLHCFVPIGTFVCGQCGNSHSVMTQGSLSYAFYSDGLVCTACAEAEEVRKMAILRQANARRRQGMKQPANTVEAQLAAAPSQTAPILWRSFKALSSRFVIPCPGPGLLGPEADVWQQQSVVVDTDTDVTSDAELRVLIEKAKSLGARVDVSLAEQELTRRRDARQEIWLRQWRCWARSVLLSKLGVPDSVMFLIRDVYMCE